MRNRLISKLVKIVKFLLISRQVSTALTDQNDVLDTDVLFMKF